MKKLLQRLRRGASSRRIIAVHLRLLESLGICGIVVELEPPDARELLRKLKPFRGPASPSAVENVVPLPRLLATVFKLADGRLLAVYRAPVDIKDEVLEVLGRDRRFRRIIDQRLYSVPVRGCMRPSEAPALFEKLHGYIFEAAKLPLDMAAIGVLDMNPLARLRREDMEPSRLIESRLGVALEAQRLYPLLRARYRVLSLYGLLGRVYYVQPSDLLRSKSLVMADASTAPRIYSAAVETMGAAYVAAGEEVTIATASADAERLHRLVREAGAEIVDVVFSAIFPPPIEMYDCKRGRYTLEPLSIEEVMECLEKASRKHPVEGRDGDKKQSQHTQHTGTL